MISFVETVEHFEDTMRVDIRLGALSTLAQAIPTSSHSRSTDPVDLDKVEVCQPPMLIPRATSLILALDPKVVLQISKRLYLLHQSAKLVHANVMPWTVLIIAAISLSSACIVKRDLTLTLG